MKNFEIPGEELYRVEDSRAFYVEFRSKCKSYVKLYIQKRRVSYADYQIGYCYISPMNLVMTTLCPVIL